MTFNKKVTVTDHIKTLNAISTATLIELRNVYSKPTLNGDIHNYRTREIAARIVLQRRAKAASK